MINLIIIILIGVLFGIVYYTGRINGYKQAVKEVREGHLIIFKENGKKRIS